MSGVTNRDSRPGAPPSPGAGSIVRGRGGKISRTFSLNTDTTHSRVRSQQIALNFPRVC